MFGWTVKREHIDGSCMNGKKDRYERYRASTDEIPARDATFEVASGVPYEPLYTFDNVNADAERDIGYPGQYPYTRGAVPDDVPEPAVDATEHHLLPDGGGDQRAHAALPRPRTDGRQLRWRQPDVPRVRHQRRGPRAGRADRRDDRLAGGPPHRHGRHPHQRGFLCPQGRVATRTGGDARRTG